MPEPAIVGAMNDFRRQVVAGETRAVQRLTNGWLGVERALETEAELSARRLLELQQAGKLITPGMVARDERFQTLLAQTRREINKYVPGAENVVTGRQRTLAGQGIDHAGEAMRAVGGAGTQFDRLNVRAVENMIGVAGDGTPLDTLLRRGYGDAAEGILDEMVRGVALGRGPERIARNVLRNGLGRGLDHMITVNRTETLRVYRESTRQSYAESGIVIGYKRIASKSPRTCAGCLAGDGMFYLLDDPFEEHVQGRCSSVPVVRGAPVPTWETGIEWLEKQPESVQRHVLGPGRYEGLRTGAFSVEQLVTRHKNATWGDSLHPTTLRDLLAGRGGVRTTPIPRVIPGLAKPPKPLFTSPELKGDVITFETGKRPVGGLTLNGIELKPAPADFDFSRIPDRAINEPAFAAGGMRRSAGVIMVEPDGRIWIVEPSGHFGGYEHTFPKGGVDAGLTIQQNALREVFEETGLIAEIDDFLIDAEGTTSVTRYYVGRRVGGAPWLGDSETWSVKLVTPDRAEDMLNTKRDKNVLAALNKRLAVADDQAKTAVAVADELIPPPPPPVPVAAFDTADATFPSTLRGLEHVRPLGGSTGAELVRDPDTGKLYVMKRGKNAGHIREEAHADRAYQALGVNVPKFRLYETPGEPPVKLAEYIEGRTLSTLRKTDKRAYSRAVKEVRKDFGADALLGNWDVVGLEYDNVLVDDGGAVWRIDNGGALRYRGMGTPKDAAGWNGYPDELWTMRGKQIIYDENGTRRDWQAAGLEVFGDMGYNDVIKQVRAVERKRDALLAALPDELRPVMRQRLDNALDLGKIHKLLTKDKWVESYVDDFSRHSIGVRKAGIVERFPAQMKQTTDRNRNLAAIDENGRLWDALRSSGLRPGERSAIDHLSEYMGRHNGEYRMIQEWAGNQAGDSWNGYAPGVKYWYANRRDLDQAEHFWWKYGIDGARSSHDVVSARFGQNAMDETLSAWHAFNYEFVRNVKFKNNNLSKGLIHLMRTEDEKVMAIHDMYQGDTLIMRRGAVESSSVWRKVTVHGTELTEQDVPHHRVFGNFMLERGPGHDTALFASDYLGENELVVMLDGLDATYTSGQFRYRRK